MTASAKREETARPLTARGEATRQRLLNAAEKIFGRRGFYAASITDITRRARVAQGTFYLYFKTKEDIFRELVAYMGHSLRHALAEAIAEAKDRMEAERLGMQAFLEFVGRHQDLYRIVMEAQFVAPAAYRAYYEDIGRAYTQALKKAAEHGEVRSGDAEIRAWALMGLGHFLGLRYTLWGGRQPTKKEMEAVMDFIGHGMAPESMA